VTQDSRIRRILEGLTIRPSAPVTAGKPADLVLQGLPAAGPAARHRAPRLEWDFGDGSRTVGQEPAASHSWARPGRFRISVTAFDRDACGIATRNVFVQPPGAALVDFANPGSWSLDSPGARERTLEPLKEGAPGGGAFLRATVRSGTRSVLGQDLPGPVDLSRAAGFSFWYRYSCDLSILSGKRTRTVGIRLRAAAGSLELIPDDVFKGEPSEDRYDWVYFPVAAGSLRASGQPDLRSVTGIELVFGPDAPADCIFCAGGLLAWEELA
jgi:hypothetical protein